VVSDIVDITYIVCKGSYCWDDARFPSTGMVAKHHAKEMLVLVPFERMTIFNTLCIQNLRKQ